MAPIDDPAADAGKTLEALRAENQRLRQRLFETESRLEELDNTVSAIQGGLVDAVVVDRQDLPEIWTLEAADRLYLRLALQAARAGTWDWDLTTGHVSLSEDLESLLGFVEGSLTANPDAWRQVIHAEDRARAGARLEQAISEGGDYYDEFRVVRPDGEVRWLAARGHVMRDGEGKLARLIGVHLDITERKQAEETLREADRRKNEFLAMLAHELRNPLGAIANAVHLIRVPNVSNEDRRWVDEMLDRQMEQFTRLIDDLLDVARITQGKIDLKREPVDLIGLARRTVETLRPRFDVARHELSVTCDAGPMWVYGDPTRLEQVLVNVLTNAIKYTKEGGRVWLRVERAGSQAVVSVRDTGVGISAEMLPHIFELFTQAEQGRDRAQGGLGIGLALVRRLVEMHGGAITARSEGVGRGSEFVIRLPLGEPPPTPRAALGDAAATQSDARRILVVDDNRAASSTLALLLETYGHQTAAVFSGKEALETLESFRPDVALLDIGLPDMNGLELAKQIRRRFDDTLLIAVSGYGQLEDKQQSQEAGFFAHLVKPVDHQELLALLKQTAGAKPGRAPRS